MGKTPYEIANNNCIIIQGEEWRDVLGYEGLYQVSSIGRVRRLPTITIEYTESGEIVKETRREMYLLSPSLNTYGYYQVGLTRFQKTRFSAVHLLVASAFLFHDAEHNEVHHKDRISTNNSVDNLEWVSSREHKEYHRKKQHRDYLKAQ